MNKIQAAHNVATTAVSTALAETAGHKGTLEKADQDHAQAIVDAIVRIIEIKIDGSGEEHYG